MGNVIFIDGKLDTKRERPLEIGHTATILIFQGVRVERLTDDMIAQTKSHLRRLPAMQNQAIAEELE